MDGDGRGLSDGIKTPDSVKYLILAENDIGVRGEKGEQIELLVRQRHLFVADKNAAGVGVNRELADIDDIIYRLLALGGQALISRYMRRDAGDELRRAERLCNIVVRSEAEASYFVNLILLGRHHEHGTLLVLAYLAASLKAV